MKIYWIIVLLILCISPAYAFFDTQYYPIIRSTTLNNTIINQTIYVNITTTIYNGTTTNITTNITNNIINNITNNYYTNTTNNFTNNLTYNITNNIYNNTFNGTVTQVNTGIYTTGGPITTTGTIDVNTISLETLLDSRYLQSYTETDPSFLSQNLTLVREGFANCPSNYVVMNITINRTGIFTKCVLHDLGIGYETILDENTELTQRQKISFRGNGITCVDNSTQEYTQCTVNLSSETDPIWTSDKNSYNTTIQNYLLFYNISNPKNYIDNATALTVCSIYNGSAYYTNIGNWSFDKSNYNNITADYTNDSLSWYSINNPNNYSAYSMKNGSILPTCDYAGNMFYQITTGRKTIMLCNGTSWSATYNSGTWVTYVDKDLGTNDGNHGNGTGSDAYDTIAYALTQIPTVSEKDVVIYVSNGTYNETLTLPKTNIQSGYFYISGSNVNPYNNITQLNSTAAANTVFGSTTTTSAGAVGSYGFVCNSSASYTFNAYKGMLLYDLSNNRYTPIVSNNGTCIYFVETSGLYPVAINRIYIIKDWATVLYNNLITNNQPTIYLPPNSNIYLQDISILDNSSTANLATIYATNGISAGTNLYILRSEIGYIGNATLGSSSRIAIWASDSMSVNVRDSVIFGTTAIRAEKQTNVFTRNDANYIYSDSNATFGVGLTIQSGSSLTMNEGDLVTCNKFGGSIGIQSAAGGIVGPVNAFVDNCDTAMVSPFVFNGASAMSFNNDTLNFSFSKMFFGDYLIPASYDVVSNNASIGGFIINSTGAYGRVNGYNNITEDYANDSVSWLAISNQSLLTTHTSQITQLQTDNTTQASMITTLNANNVTAFNLANVANATANSANVSSNTAIRNGTSANIVSMNITSVAIFPKNFTGTNATGSLWCYRFNNTLIAAGIVGKC